MQKGRYYSQNGEEYELIGLATDSETSEKRIIFRKANDISVFVCSKVYWNGLGLVPSAEYKSSGITKYSSGNDKIELYLSLFAGRSDVYAKRWESRSGKSGYSPVCTNEWRPGVCLKPGGKCSDCSFKSYEPFNASVVDKHLRGRITAGVYPLCKDETCRFLAVDFDDGEWQKDICAVYELCKTHNIPAYMERSRSGSGGHLWIFFSENIPSPLARRLGSSILTAAMNERHEIGFSSYDRLFPNQDTMPKGGFGNLIALPLQKQPRKNGNSVFVDENLEPYADQWQLLASVKKLSEADVRRAVNAFSNEEMGQLYEDDSEKPWEKKELVRVSGSDIPPKVNIVLANMIYVEKAGISSRGLNTIKRFASFKNPDFYKSQAMRLSTYGKPRIISLSDETGKYIGEGFDYPRLDTLMLAMPISWKGTLQQYAGRLHRSYNGKDEVRVYDYIDIHVPMLEKMYQKRLKGYSSIGYKVKSEDGYSQNISGIYNNESFLEVFVSDIIGSEKNVIIVSPFVSKRVINKMLGVFDEAADRIEIITRPPENYNNESGRLRAAECIEYMRELGLRVSLKSMFHQKFAVIDGRIVWYGSINFLSYGASEENVMRLRSAQVASELVDTIR